MQEWQQIMIEFIGWAYFICWSVSFYGQIYENWRLKNVEGMNLDFVELNFTGFFFYSVYNTQGYFFNQDQTGEVDFNDVLFSYHALAATIYMIYQSCIYERGTNKVHLATKIVLGILWTFTILYYIITHFTKVIEVPKHFGVFTLMGIFKLVITFLKYAPQLYWNYVRKSTKGWSIMGVLLDFSGGLLSFGQTMLQAFFEKDAELNVVKIILGSCATMYNVFFILQHYYWYGPVDHKTDQIPESSTTEIERTQNINQEISEEMTDKNSQ